VSKRAVAGLLWFFSIWATYELLWSVVGAPRLIGPILGLVAASLVVVDPTGRFWGVPLAVNVTRLTGSRLESEQLRVPRSDVRSPDLVADQPGYGLTKDFTPELLGR